MTTPLSTRGLAQQYGVSRTTIENRLRAGWTPGEPLNFGERQAGFMQKRIMARLTNPVSAALRKWPKPQPGE